MHRRPTGVPRSQESVRCAFFRCLITKQRVGLFRIFLISSAISEQQTRETFIATHTAIMHASQRLRVSRTWKSLEALIQGSPSPIFFGHAGAFLLFYDARLLVNDLATVRIINSITTRRVQASLSTARWTTTHPSKCPSLQKVLQKGLAFFRVTVALRCRCSRQSRVGGGPQTSCLGRSFRSFFRSFRF